MDFRDLFKQLGMRPRMYLPDDRFHTLVAFIEGCNAATDWKLLAGFNEWVATHTLGQKSSFHWSVIVASKIFPTILDESGAAAIPGELEGPASEELLRVLDSYLATRQMT
ncbi:hypothetical protein [Phytohabitans rumicis]|uniref:Uncharacterized protein n=1 Tax=Phytohabitans rumicis TaxID=1076125 RepID=A0A6V8KYT0_9ACTN|nr:hypothetical protein [Phytohabitans rumicis]GFJ87601.1 hypothetical protein Prum_012430 [Phytohabitans rumicis]